MQNVSSPLRQEYSPMLADTEPVRYFGGPWELPSGETSFVHYHTCFELSICTEGSGIFLSPDKVEPITQGDASLILPGGRHYSRSLKKCSCQFLYVDLYGLFDLLGITDAAFTDLIKESVALDVPLVIREGEYPEMNMLIRRAIRGYTDALKNGASERAADGSGADSALSMYKLLAIRLSEILILCGERFSRAAPKSQEHTVLNPAVEYISLHYERQITVDELAELCSVSRSTLWRQFRAEYHLSPLEYLTRFRCRTAAMLLIHTDYSVGEIAERVGYQDISDFYRNFVAWKHQSPSGFRKTHKSGAGNGRKNK